MMRDDVLHMQMQPVCSAWFASMLGTVQPPQRPSSQLPHHLGPYKTSVRRGALLYGQLHRGLGTEPLISVVGPYYKGAFFSLFLPWGDALLTTALPFVCGEGTKSSFRSTA